MIILTGRCLELWTFVLIDHTLNKGSRTGDLHRQKMVLFLHFFKDYFVDYSLFFLNYSTSAMKFVFLTDYRPLV